MSTTLTIGSTLFLASYASTYPVARIGAGAVVSDWPWIGQYFSGQYEVNQVFGSFDTTSLSGQIVEATLTMTVLESYGDTVLEVREHDWPATTAAFVPGDLLNGKRLVGSAPLGPGGERDISIPLGPIDQLRPFKFLMTISDQTNNVAPTGDTTLIVDNVRLTVTVANRARFFTWL